MRIHHWFAIACPLLLSGCIQAAEPATRADLAASYLRFESALRDNPPPAERIAEINRTFDKASIAFFSFRYSSAIQDIEGLTESISPARGVDAERRVARSLKLRFDPPVFRLESPAPVRLTLRSLYPATAGSDGPARLKLRLKPAAGEPIDVSLDLPQLRDGELDVEQELALDTAKIRKGAYGVSLLSSDGVEFDAGKWHAVPRSLDNVRDDFLRRLSDLKPTEPRILTAVETCRARASLLTDEPSELDSAQFLADPNALTAAIESEIDSLSKNIDPYARKPGDLWRAFSSGGTTVRLRFFAPSSIQKEPDRARALVIAFHGAGGDENMFMDAYGAGRLKVLAEQRDFLLATPFTNPFLQNAELFDRLIDEIADDYAVDPDRVYVIGHSLGGGAASILARQRNNRIAAACCIAGGTLNTAGPLSPTLVYSGELDPINPSARFSKSVERAIAAGQPIDFRKIADHGHTLTVGHVMDEALTWLLERKRNAAKPAARPANIAR